MEAIGNFDTFASLGTSLNKEHDDVLYFRSAKDPSHVKIVDIASHPIDWESVAFDGSPPDTEDTLAFPKGTYVILYSAKANTAAFYRVRGSEKAVADTSMFKQSLTLLNEYRNELNRAKESIASIEAVSTVLAEKLDKKERKIRKLKKKLKDSRDRTWENIAEVVATVLINNGVIQAPDAQAPEAQAPDAPNVTVTPSESGDGYDYHQ